MHIYIFIFSGGTPVVMNIIVGNGHYDDTRSHPR